MPMVVVGGCCEEMEDNRLNMTPESGGPNPIYGLKSVRGGRPLYRRGIFRHIGWPYLLRLHL
ncbi:MAG TPA: hypothetical protein DD640_03615 [Clostridiales bacterium]|nr:hypothetical protein [Clostridiales bacterium]